MRFTLLIILYRNGQLSRDNLYREMEKAGALLNEKYLELLLYKMMEEKQIKQTQSGEYQLYGGLPQFNKH